MGTLLKGKGGSSATKKTTSSQGSGGGFKFKYKPRTAEEVRAKAQRAIGGRDSFFNSEVQFFTPREGENMVRIMPPPPESDWGHYGKTLFVHYDIGPDSSTYLCLAKMKDETCPICEARAEASAKGEEDYAKELKPSERVAVYVIDRSQEGKGPLVWNLPAGTDKDIVKLVVDKTTGEVLNVDDPNEGYDLSFTREGTGLKTKYKGIAFARRPSPLSDDPEIGEKWLEHIVEHPIEACMVYHDADHISKVFEGQAPVNTSDDDDEAEEPKKAKGGGKKEKEKEDDKPARARIAPRKVEKPEPEEPEAAEDDEPEKPSWEELEAMDDDALGEVGEAFGLTFPDDGFEDIESLRDFVAAELEIEKPKPAKEEKGGGKKDWRSRLASMGKKK